MVLQYLRRLGEILHSTRNGYIVVRLEEPEKLPPLGVPVFNENRQRVGLLLDIIGPVKAPYGVIRPDSKDIIERIKYGEVVYYLSPRPRRRRSKKSAQRIQRRKEVRGRKRGKYDKDLERAGERASKQKRRSPR